VRWIRAPRRIGCIPAHRIDRQAPIHHENLRLNIEVCDTRDTDAPLGHAGTGGMPPTLRAGRSSVTGPLAGTGHRDLGR
jgi:hypothetical protein